VLLHQAGQGVEKHQKQAAASTRLHGYIVQHPGCLAHHHGNHASVQPGAPDVFTGGAQEFGGQCSAHHQNAGRRQYTAQPCPVDNHEKEHGQCVRQDVQSQAGLPDARVVAVDGVVLSHDDDGQERSRAQHESDSETPPGQFADQIQAGNHQHRWQRPECRRVDRGTSPIEGVSANHLVSPGAGQADHDGRQLRQLGERHRQL